MCPQPGKGRAGRAQRGARTGTRGRGHGRSRGRLLVAPAVLCADPEQQAEGDGRPRGSGVRALTGPRGAARQKAAQPRKATTLQLNVF